MLDLGLHFVFLDLEMSLEIFSDSCKRGIAFGVQTSGDRGGYVPATDATNIIISNSGSSSGSGNHSQRLPRSSDGLSYGAV